MSRITILLPQHTGFSVIVFLLNRERLLCLRRSQEGTDVSGELRVSNEGMMHGNSDFVAKDVLSSYEKKIDEKIGKEQESLQRIPLPAVDVTLRGLRPPLVFPEAGSSLSSPLEI